MNRLLAILLVCLVAGCNVEHNADSGSDEAAPGNQISEAETKRVLDHHWEAFKENDLEETMEDYTEESVLITPDATYQGLDQIRENFVKAFKAFPKDSTTFSLDKSIVVSDVGYILWNSKTPAFTLTYGTDTFVVRDGKIVRQTFAGVFQ